MDELEKEIEAKGVEYADKQKRTVSIHEDSGYSWGQVEEAYERGALDFAKSREEQIKQLEEKVDKFAEAKEIMGKLLKSYKYITKYNEYMDLPLVEQVEKFLEENK